ncbi:glycosyltransferase [Flavobacterium sp. GA093]|uniref:Glycosyltransferase n=1 Tax=Flavobacterium hydrocarbonoxydans TaxID=2683249 RepID=A0A6I4NQ23_9FLAO|nr:glycosyltransferase family 4 protein [Flavobacterium hydrocarbonoxydans]MWB96518.1 glycosyltransferase [Flavobacterium hydrocarbonoxydans]
MKLLYITQRANEEGGVQRVLSIKTNYLIEKFGYEIAIVTQNKGNVNLFFEFNEKINFYDIELKGNKVFNLLRYKKELQKHIKQFQPDCIVVCDFALKSFSIPLLLDTKISIIFEAHGSKFNEYKVSHYFEFINELKYQYRNYCASKFSTFVALSKESLSEWNVNNAVIIPNPLWFQTDVLSDLKSKRVIAVARHSYEKGIDRLLKIWAFVSQKHSDWILEIYGKTDKNLELQNLAKKLNIEEKIVFLEPIKNIQNKYTEASILAMTSRNEALPMVLIEAMACGLPCIAYDCPVGPKAIIKDNENGFLIEDGNQNSFAEKLNLLIEDENLRIKMSQNAKSSVAKYDLDAIMKQWKNLFESIVKN